MNRDQVELMIGRQVAETISEFGIKGDIEVSDIVSCYVMAIGASMSVVYDDLTDLAITSGWHKVDLFL